ncbi:hypothetical protein SmJEL517_g01151 [Synchytrium microbalum]|uniref:Mitochondrial proton/calcium exchanger protein n=1 Tax=Synchytrium microbalum TaxID=1806994 RepID=A0A507C6F3_9FUNG|nr:uncharacterized protein SmJEL517_g01151 [Synchytrium microbalum]TPX36617.1 hypothetical protein SmJEL517_g01151 [Synchytrium microbalum]
MMATRAAQALTRRLPYRPPNELNHVNSALRTSRFIAYTSTTITLRQKHTLRSWQHTTSRTLATNTTENTAATSKPDSKVPSGATITPPSSDTTNVASTSQTASTTPPSLLRPAAAKEETPVERAVRVAKEGELDAMDKAWRESEVVDEDPANKVKKPIMERIKNELVHYWHGTKLLGAEIAISSRLLMLVLRGHKLTRREQRQLRRTTGDFLRLVPFLIFVIVPFLEFALPLFLRFFPNMLPSTFESKFDEQEKKKRLLKVRLEMAKFLQDTIEDVSIAGTSKAEAAKEFSQFFLKYRTSGEQAPNEEIIRIARKFEDNLTLNNLSRPQLVSMCKYMNINAFGTDNFLRHQIQRKMKELESDDKTIAEEGIESLNVKELQQACASRGIRTIGVSPARLRSELAQWLDLHLKNQIPSTLLVLSRAFTFDRPIDRPSDTAEALQAALHSLPHQVVNETALGIAEAEGKATYKQKLEVLKEQEELIEDESEQEEALMKVKMAKEAEQRKKAAAATPTIEAPPAPIQIAAPQPTAAAAPSKPAEPAAKVSEAPTPPAAEPIPAPAKPAAAPAVAEDGDNISEAQLVQLGAALKILTADSVFQDVRHEVAEIKLERAEFKEDIEELKSLAKQEPATVTSRLGARVDKMIAKIEKEITSLESAPPKRQIMQTLKPDQSGRITLEELEDALKIIRDHPADERIRRIVQRLDTDNDGKVSLEEILVLADEAESEGVGVLVPEPKKETSSPASASADASSAGTSSTAQIPAIAVSSETAATSTVKVGSPLPVSDKTGAIPIAPPELLIQKQSTTTSQHDNKI